MSIQWRRFAFFDKEIISECIVQSNDDNNVTDNPNGITVL
jgi:hypothetical protein